MSKDGKPMRDRIDCHVSEEDCLLPEWIKKLRALVDRSSLSKEEQKNPCDC